jgi:hypothetical protein
MAHGARCEVGILLKFKRNAGCGEETRANCTPVADLQATSIVLQAGLSLAKTKKFQLSGANSLCGEAGVFKVKSKRFHSRSLTDVRLRHPAATIGLWILTIS